MLSLLLSFLFSAVLGQNLCGRDCLSPCRMLAIACVRGIDEETPPINPGQLLTLMQCVIGNKEKEEWKLKAPDCSGCIDAELEDVTPEQKAECLGEKGESCEKIESEANCNKATKPLVCGWIGGTCYNVGKPLANREEYKGFIRKFNGAQCKAIGGRAKEGKGKGKNLCRLSTKQRLKCGVLNKLAKKHMGFDGCVRDCKYMCTLLPNCQYKDSKSKCGRKDDFMYAFGSDKKE